MNQSKKLSRAEFLQKKEEYFKIIDNYVQDKSEEELKNFQDELLTYDLSEISAPDWDGINWYVGAFGSLIFSADFSKTHANIDFHIFKIFPVDHTTSEHWIKKCNFLGCNVDSIDQLDIYSFNDLTNDDVKKVFGNDIIQNNPKEFPSDLIPEEIQKRFYSEQLTYEDLLKYPELFDKHICKNENRLGIEGKATGVYSWNLDVLKKIAKEDQDLYHYFTQTNYYPESQDLKLDADKLKEKIAKDLYQTLIPKSATHMLRNFKDYPSFFFQHYPELHPALLDENLENKFYERRLTIQDVRKNYEQFKNIDEQILLPQFSKTIKQFGGMKNFLDYIPPYFDQYIQEYNDQTLSQIGMEINVEDKKKLAMTLLHSIISENMDYSCILNYVDNGGQIDSKKFPILSNLYKKYGNGFLKQFQPFFSQYVQSNNHKVNYWTLFANNYEEGLSFESNLKNHFFTAEELQSAGIPEEQLSDALLCSNQALYGNLHDVLTLYKNYPQLTKLANQKNFNFSLCRYFGYEALTTFNEQNNHILELEFLEENPIDISKIITEEYIEIIQNQSTSIIPTLSSIAQKCIVLKKDLEGLGYEGDELEKLLILSNQGLLSGSAQALFTVLKKYPNLTTVYLQKRDIVFKGKDQILNYIKDKKLLLSLSQKYGVEDVKKIIDHIAFSNSSEIQRIGENLIDPIMASDNPYQALDQIEDLFLRNNLPYVAKAYQVFKILYPGYKENYGSPMLNAKSNRGKDILIFSDLIKASFGSNNRSVLNYLESIEKGNRFFQQVLANPNQLNHLSNRDKEILETYLGHLNALYNQTMRGRLNGIEEAHRLGQDTYENVLEMAKLFSKDGNFDYNLPDRLTRMFCHFAGIDTFEDAKKYIQAKVTVADKRHREATKHQFVIEKGDFVKGLGDIEYIETILQNGSVCKEFLGYASGSDATPLDTDLTRIVEQQQTFKDTYDTRIKGYGNISAVLKCDDRFIITKTSYDAVVDKANFDTTKLEAFFTGAVNNTHYGIRTGFASSEIDYFVVDHNEPKLNFEIVKNGFYIPVVNEEGNLIFTPEQYDFMRTKMQGLSYYGLGDSYEFASSKDLITDEVQEIMAKNINNQQKTKEKRDAILKVVEKCLATSGITPIYELEKDLVPGTVEIIDTGSTGRGTNKPNDGDFDFMVRLDKALISDEKKLEEFKNLLRKELKTRAEVKEETGKGDFRYKGVTVDGLDEPVDIDMTFIQKTDKVEYSTDMCLRDRLETIRNLSEEKYQAVLANIILAKKVLKEGKCYKPHHAPEDIREDGLGGVGVENWILQNGGSFYEASKSFLAAAEQAQTEIQSNLSISSKSKEEQAQAEFDRFKKYYQIWDFGKNHMSEEKKAYPHDEFVYNNMAPDGYMKMKETLRSYVKKVETEKNQQAIEQQANSIVEAMAQENFTEQSTQSNYHLGYAETTSLKLLYMISILAILLLIACCIIY